MDATGFDRDSAIVRGVSIEPPIEAMNQLLWEENERLRRERRILQDSLNRTGDDVNLRTQQRDAARLEADKFLKESEKWQKLFWLAAAAIPIIGLLKFLT